MVATEKQIRRHWKKLLKLVTHPSAVWPLDPTLRRWELDPIEGPMRMRLRLKPRLAIKHPIIKTLINVDIEKLKKELDSQRFTDPRMVYLSTNLNTEALNQFYNLYSLFDTNLDSEFSQVFFFFNFVFLIFFFSFFLCFFFSVLSSWLIVIGFRGDNETRFDFWGDYFTCV